MRILGISCYFHDAAACLVEDGEIIAAAQEERFTRIQHDSDFPLNAVRYCLAESPGLLDAVAFYDKPVLKFHRILETYLSVAPSGFRTFARVVPLWLREKIWVEPEVRAGLDACGVTGPERFYFPEHHLSHAASAYYPSPFQSAAVVTIDGVGEWATASIAHGQGNRLRILQQLRFPHSLGLLYSAFTYFAGFEVDSAEYELMDLAPYGEPIYRKQILDELIDLRGDGSFRINTDYFGFLDDLVTTSPRFDALFGGPPRRPEGPLTRRELDLARSIQDVTQEIVFRMTRHALKLTGERDLCLAGGLALNCSINGALPRAGLCDGLWIQPAAGDAGGAIGAALAVWHAAGDRPTASTHATACAEHFSAPSLATMRSSVPRRQRLRVSDAFCGGAADGTRGADQPGPYPGAVPGRMEFGPRALGNRSIIADPRDPRMQQVLDRKVKLREEFRPFAPACLEEFASEWFDLERASPYMLLAVPLRQERCTRPPGPSTRRWASA
jgi:carbamoyltransferase